MNELLNELNIQGATIATLTKTLERLNRTPEDYEGEDLGPLRYELKQDMRSTAIATVEPKGFQTTRTKAPLKKSTAIASASTTGQAIAPIAPSLDSDLVLDESTDLEAIDLDSLTGEQLDRVLELIEQRSTHLEKLQKAHAGKKRLLKLKADNAAKEAEAIEVDQQLLEASETLQRQKAQLQLRRKASPELIALQQSSAEKIVRQDLDRTKAALGKLETIAAETPNTAELAEFRAKLLRSQRWNEAASIQNATLPLAIVGTPESQTQTIDAIAV